MGKLPIPVSGLDNSMDFKNHGTAKSLTRLSAYNVPFLSEKRKSIFLSFQWLTLIADMQRMGRSGERRRLNVSWGKEEWGVLDMNFLGSGGIEWEGVNIDIGDDYTALWRP